MTKPAIGYVGTGLMGLPMVKRLIERGYRVKAFDIVKEKTQVAAAAGASAATSPADAAREVDFVLLNLPTTDAVETATFGADGVASVLRKPQILIDFSTIKVAKGKLYAARLQRQTGCGWIDAPVSGGPPASATGTLTVMAGGGEADIVAASAADGGYFRPLHAYGAGGERACRQDDQPADRRLRPRGDGGGRRARGKRRHRRQAHAGMPGRRPCGQQPAAEALSAHGRARLRAAGLCAAIAQGPGDGAASSPAD